MVVDNPEAADNQDESHEPTVTAEFAATNQELMAQIDSVKDKLEVPPLTETVNTTSQDGGNDSTIYTAEFTGMAFTKQTKTVEAVKITKAVDANGAPVAADAQILAEADKPAEELTPEKAAEIIASIVDGEQTAATDDDVEVPDTVDTDSLAKVDPTDLTIVLVKDVTVPPGTAFPVTLSFELADVQDGQDVFVYHYSTDPVSGQKSWELVGTGKGKNVDATFDDLSPVVFVAQAVSVPPTGDAGYMQWVILAAAAVVVAACVLVFAGRRREE